MQTSPRLDSELGTQWKRTSRATQHSQSAAASVATHPKNAYFYLHLTVREREGKGLAQLLGAPETTSQAQSGSALPWCGNFKHIRTRERHDHL